MLTPLIIHRQPAFWPDPERFDRSGSHPRPKRGGISLPTSHLVAATYLHCNSFALMEMLLIVATMAQQYRFRLVEGIR